MLKALERAIADQGGDPCDLQRIREARRVLRDYHRLREKLGLDTVGEEREERHSHAQKPRRRDGGRPAG
ncbi:MAG TPA: hypothetical protein GXX55_03255 [Firmicutes bacterium]|nr:hypothetical protein [Bacillota bacterium]